MEIQLFIDVELLKESSVINENVDEKILRVNIAKAQDRYIQPILGTALYQKIKDDISASTLAGDYLTLVNTFIQPCLVQYTLFEGCRDMVFKWMNKSIMSKNSENSQPISMDDMKKLRDEYKDAAQDYGQILQKYLCDNSSLFPELDQNNDSWQMQPSYKSYSCPIFTGKKSPMDDYLRRNGANSINLG